MSSQNALAAPEAAASNETPGPHALRRRLLLVTGLAGAGRSTALKCLEDHGFEAVDNLPLALLPHLVSGVNAAGEAPRALAIGIDGRVPHSVLLELVTDEGIGTMVVPGGKP